MIKLGTYVKSVTAMALLAIIWGCGSGDGSGSIKTGGANVTVNKSSLASALSDVVKGIQLTLVLPDKVTVKADASNMALSGVVTALYPNDVTSSNGSLTAKYTPASGGTPGKLTIAIIRGDAAFFQQGDLFSVTCDVAPGTTVTSTQFSIEGNKVRVFDKNGVELPGATAEIVP